MYPEVLPEMPRGRQTKVSLNVELKNAPYQMPTLFVSFHKKNQESKNYNVCLPCPIHKFVEFQPVKDRQ